MSKRYAGSRTRDRLTSLARTGEHLGARRASQTARTYQKGDPVRVIQTGLETAIRNVATWGDYELEGVIGYFSSRQLEPR